MNVIPPNTPLVCIRVADLANPQVKSRQSICRLCGIPVWVAMSSPPQAVLWCWECAGIEIDERDPIEIVITEEQLADVRDAIARGK